MYDITIIGSGPAGYVAGIRARKLGKKVCIIEEKEVGGVCLNSGCIPTKVWLEGVKIKERMKKWNVKGEEVRFEELVKRKNEAVERLKKGIQFLFKSYEIELIQGKGKVKGGGKVFVGSKEIKTNSILIATGSSPNMPFGRSEKIISVDEALNIKKLPSSVIIIGGGIAGVEVATIYALLGVETTIVEMLDSILPEIKEKKIQRMIKRKLAQIGVKILEKSKVGKVKEEKNYTIVEVENNFLLKSEIVVVACGRKANLKEIEEIEVKDGYVKVSDRLQTNVPHIYAAGDVVGPPLLAHKASMEGEVAVYNMCGKERKMSYTVIPGVLYSLIEVAWVGKFEEEVSNPMVGEFPFQAVGKAIAQQEEEGFVKVVANQEGKIVGVQMVGGGVSELIWGVVLAIKKGMTPEEVGEVIFPHPTISEGIKEAMMDVNLEAIHKKR